MTAPKPPPLWTEGPDGWRATLAGRSWRMDEPRGSTAWTMYAALHARLAALGLYSGDGPTTRAALTGFGADAEVARLARQMVDWMTCDGVPVSAGFERVFAGRRAPEVSVLALEAWKALGFFSAPGQRPEATEAPPAPSTPDAV